MTERNNKPRPRLPREEALERAIAELEEEIETRKQKLAQLQSGLAGLRRLSKLLQDSTQEELHDLASAALQSAMPALRCSPVDEPEVVASWISSNGSALALLVTDSAEPRLTLQAVARAFTARAECGQSSADLAVVLVGDVRENSEVGPASRRVSVADAVVAEARQTRVLLLRTFDLWQLVAEAQSQGSIEPTFRDALDRGGWLRVEGPPELLP